MKFSLLPLGLFSISTVIYFLPSLNNIASAQCVLVDVSNQLIQSGSVNPGTQSNNVNTNVNEPCVGIGNGTFNNQTGISSGSVDQSRNLDQTVTNGNSNISNINGVGGPTIVIPVQTQTQIFNPALNSNLNTGF